MSIKAKEKKRRSAWKPRSLVAILITGFVGLACTVLVFVGMFFAKEFNEALNSWSPALDPLKWILGIVFALVFVASTFAAIMLTYLSLRQIHAKTKLRIELIVVASTILFSIVVKGMVIVLSNGHFSDALLPNVAGMVLQSIYNAFGGLQFEGLPDTGELVQLQLIPFYGTSIITALVFLGVIGSTFAYELYSYILIKVLYGFLPGKLHYDTFVFTALNEETLCLAKSVADDNKDAIIIFAGPALEPFDRHNEQCAEVMGNGFLYWSYYEDSNKTITESLGLKHKRMTDDTVFYVFAFDTDPNGVPEEEKNADTVFDDASLRKKNDALIRKKRNQNGGKEFQSDFYIHYVLLGKGENDFQAYQVKKKRSLDPNNADLSLWTESKAIAEQVANYLKCEDVLDACLPSAEGTKVRSIGFGETARAIVKELYIQSAMAKYDGNKIQGAPFFVDIYDQKSMEIAGFFKKDTPYALCYKKGEAVPQDDTGLNCPLFCFNEKNYTHIDIASEEEERNKKSDGKDDFDYCVIATGDDRENINIANSIIASRYHDSLKKNKKLILFVTIYNKRNNIFLTAPTEMIEALNINSKKDTERATAISIVKKFNKEVDRSYLIGGFSSHKEADISRKNVYRYNDNLFAVIVGNREDTYLYPSIRQQHKSAVFNSRYSIVSGQIYNYSEGHIKTGARIWANYLSSMRDFYRESTLPDLTGEKANIDVGMLKELEELFDLTKKPEDPLELDKQWAGLNLWDRQSNIEVFHYARTYLKLMMKEYGEEFREANYTISELQSGEKLFKMLALLQYIEHERWNRVHIAAGWRHCEKKDKEHRFHNCLVPMAELEVEKNYSWAYVYDLSNVLLSIRSYSEIEFPKAKENK